MKSPLLFPDLWSEAPSEKMQEALRAVSVPDGFSGTAAALLLKRGTESLLLSDCAPFSGFFERKDLPELSLISSQLRDTVLPGNSGKTLLSLFTALTSPYGNRITDQQQRLWAAELLSGTEDPLIQLLFRWKKDFPDWIPADAASVQTGAAPRTEVRQAGAFLPPKSILKPFISALLSGVPAQSPGPFCRKEPPVPLLYEDSSLIACVKPAGLASVPGTLEIFSAKAALEKTCGPLYTVHRLDQATSGILLFAKTKEAASALSLSFRNGKVRKRYEALLERESPAAEGEIRLSLLTDPSDRPRQCAVPEESGGKPSVTRYRVRGAAAAEGKKRSLIDLFPETGRTHQLRIHCAHREGLANPILGDPLYGSEGTLSLLPGRRLYLHMAETAFPHPVTGSDVHLRSDSGWQLL